MDDSNNKDRMALLYGWSGPGTIEDKRQQEGERERDSDVVISKEEERKERWEWNLKLMIEGEVELSFEMKKFEKDSMVKFINITNE